MAERFTIVPMQLPANAVISPEKLSNYLLVERPWDDKSKFLAKAGFEKHNPAELEQAIRHLTSIAEAHEDGVNEYGTFYRVTGELEGPLGNSLSVVLIWLQWKSDGQFHFVTLKPHRGLS